MATNAFKKTAAQMAKKTSPLKTVAADAVYFMAEKKRAVGEEIREFGRKARHDKGGTSSKDPTWIVELLQESGDFSKRMLKMDGSLLTLTSGNLGGQAFDAKDIEKIEIEEASIRLVLKMVRLLKTLIFSCVLRLLARARKVYQEHTVPACKLSDSCASHIHTHYTHYTHTHTHTHISNPCFNTAFISSYLLSCRVGPSP